MDIDLNDPEVEKAAVKIQAGFKGFKARQEIKEMKVSEQQPEGFTAINMLKAGRKQNGPICFGT